MDTRPPHGPSKLPPLLVLGAAVTAVVLLALGDELAAAICGAVMVLLALAAAIHGLAVRGGRPSRP
jgi:hypothetical protein